MLQAEEAHALALAKMREDWEERLQAAVVQSEMAAEAKTRCHPLPPTPPASNVARLWVFCSLFPAISVLELCCFLFLLLLRFTFCCVQTAC